MGWIFFGLGGVILLTITFFLIIAWTDSIKNTPKIKFKSFKNFYTINPNRWRLYDDYVVCSTTRIWSLHDATFHFGLIDFYRYKLFKCHLNKIKKVNLNKEIVARMIIAVEQDVEFMKELEALNRSEE